MLGVGLRAQDLVKGAGLFVGDCLVDNLTPRGVLPIFFLVVTVVAGQSGVTCVLVFCVVVREYAIWQNWRIHVPVSGVIVESR